MPNLYATRKRTYYQVVLYHIRLQQIGTNENCSADDPWIALVDLQQAVVQIHLYIETVLKENIGWLRMIIHIGGRQQRRKNRRGSDDVGNRLGGHKDVVIRLIYRRRSLHRAVYLAWLATKSAKSTKRKHRSGFQPDMSPNFWLLKCIPWALKKC